MDAKPGRGDIVWLDLSPTAGHEQRGKPALVLSPVEYNRRTGLLIACPITTRAKGYPFEVALRGKVKGVVLADQVRTVDWIARKARKAGKAPERVVQNVAEKLRLLLP